jgi:hypothetical protein
MIRKKIPDLKKAFSLAESAKRDMQFTLTLSLNSESSNTIIRNIYECFRMLGESLLTAKGIESTDHIVPINELISLNVKTKRPIIILDGLRKLRRNINYYGYMANPAEAADITDFAKSCFKPILEEVMKILNKLQNKE